MGRVEAASQQLILNWFHCSLYTVYH